MKRLSSTSRRIERSPIRIMLDRAAAIADAIELEIGQPDVAPPAHALAAAVCATKYEYTGYTANAGMIELRQAICDKLARENNMCVSTDNVIVTIGAMEAVFASMAVLLDPDDEILLPDPGYGNFVMASRILKSQCVSFPTLPEQGFAPDFEVLETLVTPRTKAMLINSPGNPTGAVYSKEVLQECLAFCRRHDLYLMSDETYDRLVFEGEHFSPAQWDTEGRVISIFTMSKTYSMTGWRVGYAVASKEIIDAMVTIQEPICSCVNTVAQHAAIAALNGPQDYVQEMLEHYRARRDVAVAVAEENGLNVSYPHGAFYMLVDISSQPKGSMAFSIDLLDKEHVAVGPGCAFGQLCDHYVRISLCANQEKLQEGLTRLARYLHSVSGDTNKSPETEPALENSMV